jgi:preprotein translocase subunit YajC
MFATSFAFSPFLISTAFAEAASETAAPPGGSGTSVYMNFLPLLLIFAVFYWFVIRPQNKKVDDQTKMIKALQRGDRIITTGGIYGKIVKLDGDDNLIIEIADNVQIKIGRSFVQSLAAKTQPLITSAESDAADKKN